MDRKIVNSMLSAILGRKVINVTSTNYAYVFRDNTTGNHYICNKDGSLMSCGYEHSIVYKYNNKILLLIGKAKIGEKYLTVFDTELDKCVYEDTQFIQFYQDAGVIKTREGYLLLNKQGRVSVKGKSGDNIVKIGNSFVTNYKKSNILLDMGLDRENTYEGHVVILNSKLGEEKEYLQYKLTNWYESIACVQNIKTNKFNVIKHDGKFLTTKDNTVILRHSESKNKAIVVLNYYQNKSDNSIDFYSVNKFMTSVCNGRMYGKITFSIFDSNYKFNRGITVNASVKKDYDTIFFIGKYIGFRNTNKKLYHFYEINSNNTIVYSMSAESVDYYGTANHRTVSYSLRYGTTIFEPIRNMIVQKADKKGVIDENGNFILEPIYDTVRQMEQCKRVYVVIKDGLKSVLDCKKGVFYDLKATDITGVKDYTIYYRCGYVDKQLDLKK